MVLKKLAAVIMALAVLGENVIILKVDEIQVPEA